MLGTAIAVPIALGGGDDAVTWPTQQQAVEEICDAKIVLEVTPFTRYSDGSQEWAVVWGDDTGQHTARVVHTDPSNTEVVPGYFVTVLPGHEGQAADDPDFNQCYWPPTRFPTG